MYKKLVATFLFIFLFTAVCGIATEQKIKEFVIAVENIEYLPYYGVDPQKPENYIGFAREFLDSFAKKQGYVFKYQPLPVKRLFKEFIEGMYDFKYPDNPFWSADDKKGKTIFYSESVTDYTDGIMVHADNKHINLDDLVVIGTVRGFTAWDYLDHIKSGKLELVENNTLFGLLQQVAMKRIDGCYVNNAVAAKAIKESEDALANIVFAPQLPHTKSSYKLSTQKHPQIIEELNKFLQENKKEIDAMRSRYNIKMFADQNTSSETVDLEEQTGCPVKE